MVRADHGWLTVMYDDDVTRRGIGPRFHRAEALEIARIVARLLRELEEKGELPKLDLSRDESSSKVKPGWERG